MARAINKSDPFGIPKILEEAEERIRNYYTADEKKAKIREVVKETCRKNNINIEELYYGGRRRNVSFARAQAARILIDFGITLAEVARNLGVTTSAIFNMLKRKNDKFN
jgi:putative transposase